MAWTDIPDTDIDVGSYAREDLVFQRLRDNMRALRIALFAWLFPEATTTSASWVTLTGTQVSVLIPNFPDYTAYQRKLRFVFDKKIAGGGTADYRIRETVSGNTGPALVGIASTSYTAGTVEIDVAASWVDTSRTFELQAQKVGGGTAYAQSINRVSATLFF